MADNETGIVDQAMSRYCEMCADAAFRQAPHLWRPRPGDSDVDLLAKCIYYTRHHWCIADAEMLRVLSTVMYDGKIPAQFFGPVTAQTTAADRLTALALEPDAAEPRTVGELARRRIDDAYAVLEHEAAVLDGIEPRLAVPMPDPDRIAPLLEGKTGMSAMFTASIVSALIAYEEANGWRHLVTALGLLVKFIRWARNRRKEARK